MIVLDASAMVEALVGSNVSTDLLDLIADDLGAPHVLDIEVLSVLRGLTLGRKLDADAADAARVNYFDLQITRYDTAPLAQRVWQLRHQFTSYDAAYLALAEALDCPLHTCDAKLAVPGHGATVVVHPVKR